MKNNKKINNQNMQDYNINQVGRESIFDKLTIKQKIVIIPFCLILLVLGNYLIGNFNVNKKELSYKNISSELIIEDSNVSYDREVYWRANEIIRNIISANNKDEKFVASYYKYDINEYYNFLTSKYKKNINRFQFKSKLNNIIEKCSDIVYPIEKIYRYQDTTYYLVKIKSDDNIYIGIDMVSDANQYYIFYIE